jgi:hypothetical protein
MLLKIHLHVLSVIIQRLIEAISDATVIEKYLVRVLQISTIAIQVSTIAIQVSTMNVKKPIMASQKNDSKNN